MTRQTIPSQHDGYVIRDTLDMNKPHTTAPHRNVCLGRVITNPISRRSFVILEPFVSSSFCHTLKVGLAEEWGRTKAVPQRSYLVPIVL